VASSAAGCPAWAGNFYTAEDLTAPFHARVERVGRALQMPDPRAGHCNECHTYLPREEIEGRIYVP
jgi:hypothetical protein